MKRLVSIFGAAVLGLAVAAVADTPTAGHPIVVTRQLPPPSELASPGFFIDFADAAVGRGLDDPERLPAGFRKLWDNAMENETNSNLPGTLEALRTLYAAFAAAPHGLERLDAISRREKQESFAQWMGTVHADLLASTQKGTMFNLSDVNDVERPVLIGIFKERTGPALEPLKGYFPPVDEKTGKLAAFTPDQLSGITVSNAIEMKHDALYASAVLLAQMSLEPSMPLGDRQLLRVQLVEVRRVLSAASGLEPAARAAMAQAERDKRLADYRARQDAARHPAVVAH